MFILEYDSYPTNYYSHEAPTSYGSARSAVNGPLKVVWEIATLGLDIGLAIVGF